MRHDLREQIAGRTEDEPVHLPTELPVLAPCEWTGRGVASIAVDDVRQRQGAVAIALVAIVLAVLAIAALLR